jgi:hypothetical protein
MLCLDEVGDTLVGDARGDGGDGKTMWLVFKLRSSVGVRGWLLFVHDNNSMGQLVIGVT